MYKDKELKKNDNDNEWIQFEEIRNKYFFELKNNIQIDEFGWHYLSNIPNELVEFHNNKNGILVGGDYSLGIGAIVGL